MGGILQTGTFQLSLKRSEREDDSGLRNGFGAADKTLHNCECRLKTNCWCLVTL